MGKLPYKQPSIVKAKRGWFIALHYEEPNSPGKYKRFEISAGLNYIKDIAEREKEFKRLLKTLNKELENGFNPFFPELEEKFVSSIETKETALEDIAIAKNINISSWSINDAFNNYIKNCNERNLSDNTIRTYQTFINNLSAWLASEEEIKNIRACDFTEEMILKFVEEQYDEEEEWSPRTYNNHLRFFVTFFKKAQKLEKKTDKSISYVIDLSEIEYKKDRAEKNRYYTPHVADKVKELLNKDLILKRYIEWIYYSCMRPREIRLLQVKHIDLKSRQIKAIAPTAKTGDRFVPICDELFEMIKSMNLQSYPANFYVFGTSGNTDKKPAYKGYYSTLYMPIKEKLGLDEKYTLYGWKHTRVVDLLTAGFTDPEVMSLTGHKDYKSFQAYKRDLVLDNKKMKGKTIGF